MRFFIALEIPTKNLPSLQSIQQNLHTLIPQARITDLEKVHLTLAFVGEQNDDLKDSLIKVIKDSADGIPPFEVTPAYIDGFPTIHNPHVLWVGVKGDIDKILKIRERIKDGLQKLNLPVDERRFTPHITIAKTPASFHLTHKLEVDLDKIMATPFPAIEISSIKLFESTPNEGFHSHNMLAEVKLTAAE
jgi:RNA 2',3'-cyclic 3'-phosphodiesterase